MPNSANRKRKIATTTISKRLTIFYGISLFVLLLLLFFTLYLIMSRSTRSLSKPVLQRSVTDVGNELIFETNTISIREDIDLFRDGVSIIIYSSDGKIVLGTIPQGFPKEIALKAESHRTVSGVSQWNIYDLRVDYMEQTLWIRGIYPTEAANAFFRGTMLAMFIIFPLFAIVVVLVGYFITRQTLAPLQQLTKTVNEIGSSADLKDRIPEDNKKNRATHEIDILTMNFNDMLDRLQDTFHREQQFTSDASHELRTPIAAIMAQAGAGLMEDATQEDKTHALERIAQQSKNMNTLINQLLELTRADRGTLEVHMEKLDLTELSEIVIESLQEMADSYNIQLNSHLDEDIFILGDEVMIMRMLINLISNGIKYGQTGGFVNLDLRKDEDNALISVSDNGIGIAEEDLEKIFHRFYRVSKNRTNTGEYSSGLGLSMVEWIVDIHEGSIDVSSTLRLGSKFIIRIPLA